ncbi:MAG: aspartate aminotransferase family protein [Treponema sp.]|nr:aspartate aminotransferase family protein [Treponema sp.]
MINYFMDTYQRLPVTFTKGEGSWLFDTNGKKYLDFGSGIAVNLLGHNYPPLVNAVSEQAKKFFHVCNYYQSDTSLSFAQKLAQICKMKNVFFANSGAEANEGAVKIARKYSLLKYGTGRHTIVTLKGSFHGRTITTLSATGQEKFHKDFGPFTDGFLHIPCGDIDTLEKTLDEKKVCALLIEAIQGESGIVPQNEKFMAEASRLCKQRDILMIFDEIQCGLGRTGSFLAYEQYKDEDGNPIKADIITLAKGLAAGIPCGAVLAGEKTSDVFVTGDHGSTFGGNPIAAAAALVMLDTVNNPKLLEENVRKGNLLMNAIKTFPKVKETRGRGLMIGFDIEGNSREVLEKSLLNDSHGLLLLSSGPNTIRLLPPYTITDSEIEQGLAILKLTL